MTPEAKRFIEYGAVYREGVKSDTSPLEGASTPSAKATKIIGARENKYGKDKMSKDAMRKAKNQ